MDDDQRRIKLIFRTITCKYNKSINPSFLLDWQAEFFFYRVSSQDISSQEEKSPDQTHFRIWAGQSVLLLYDATC